MNKALWLSYSSDGLSIGFKTADDAVDFLNSQSKNPDWQSQFTVTREFLYDGWVWTVSTDKGISFSFTENL